MKRLKVIFSFLILSLVSNNCVAQPNTIHEIESFSSDIFKFLNQLNDDIDSFFIKENIQRLNRKLGYFKNDLSTYLNIRKDLMDYMNKNNYNVHDNQSKEIVSKLKKELGKLTKRLNDLRPYVNNNLSSDAKDFIDRIYQPMYSQRMLYLTELDKLLDGQNVDKGRLKKNGEIIYDELLKSVGLINSIQIKLKSM